MDYLDYTITQDAPYHDGRATCYPWYFEPSEYEGDVIDDGYGLTLESALEEAKEAIRSHYADYWKVETTIQDDSVVVLHYQNGGYSVEFRASDWNNVEDTYLDSNVESADEALMVARWIKGLYPKAELCQMWDFENAVKGEG